jgi:hypothetical protein
MEKLNGPVPPDMATDRSAEDPLQMAAVPDSKTEVMGGPTVTATDEPKSVAAQPPASSNVVNEYVPLGAFSNVKLVLG